MRGLHVVSMKGESTQPCDNCRNPATVLIVTHAFLCTVCAERTARDLLKTLAELKRKRAPEGKNNREAQKP